MEIPEDSTRHLCTPKQKAYARIRSTNPQQLNKKQKTTPKKHTQKKKNRETYKKKTTPKKTTPQKTPTQKKTTPKNNPPQKNNPQKKQQPHPNHPTLPHPPTRLHLRTNGLQGQDFRRGLGQEHQRVDVLRSEELGQGAAARARAPREVVHVLSP